MENDYYSWGAQELGKEHPSRQAKEPRAVVLKPGLLLEDVQTGWVGVVVSLETIGGMRVFGLEDSRGRVKSFPLGYGFLLEGQPVKVLAPQPRKRAPEKLISASGSRVVSNLRAQVAKESRLWVEGIHDAELLEKVWGHDLRVEGIAVEPLHGIDNLAQAIAAFAPSPKRKLGILVDHLITGSKESHLLAQAMQVPGASGNVLILGHPFVDVWQAIKPQALGISSWPRIPRNEEWKRGVLRCFGWAHESQADIAEGWQKILSKVNSYADLEPSILGPVEELIDFLTTPE